MLPEVGSNFWIAPEELTASPDVLSVGSFGISGADTCWLSSGRSAIGFVLDDIQKEKSGFSKKAILPSFTCETVILPFVERGYELIFADIDSSMHFDADSLLSAVNKGRGGVFLFHRYFGFDTTGGLSELMTELKRHEITAIEDRTQSLYSDLPECRVDYYVGSIRKWCGVPDGGFAVKKNGIFTGKPIAADRKLEAAKVNAGLLKYDYIVNQKGDRPSFLERYREAEGYLDDQKTFFAISETSKKLQSHLNLDILKERRRKNYLILQTSLKIRLAFYELCESNVPLYCPLFAEDRNGLQAFLREHAVYAPILWPRYPAISEEQSRELYEHLLCIPIDQRYDTDDMNRVSGLINRYMEGHNDR